MVRSCQLVVRVWYVCWSREDDGCFGVNWKPTEESLGWNGPDGERTLNEAGNTARKGGAKGPFLLEEIGASLGVLDEVDGVPGSQPRQQRVTNQQARRRVVGRAHLAPGDHGQQSRFPCRKDGRYGEVWTAVVHAPGGGGLVG